MTVCVHIVLRDETMPRHYLNHARYLPLCPRKRTVDRLDLAVRAAGESRVCFEQKYRLAATAPTLTSWSESVI